MIRFHIGHHLSRLTGEPTATFIASFSTNLRPICGTISGSSRISTVEGTNVLRYLFQVFVLVFWWEKDCQSSTFAGALFLDKTTHYHTHTHMHILIHTYIHIYIYIKNIHLRKCTWINKHQYIWICKCRWTCICIHTNIYLNTHIYIYVYTQIYKY